MELLKQNPEIQEIQQQGLTLLLESQVDLAAFHLIVASPGVSPSHPLYQMALLRKIELIGEVELALRSLQGPCLAVTGSNGKTTTVLLTEHVLNQSGIPARALGNVGTPLSAAVDELKGEVVVAELSSWQLETLSVRTIDAAVILNITPNHLDRHGSMEAYAAAKLRMVRCLKEHAPLYMEMEAHQRFAHMILPFRPRTFGYEPRAMLFCDQKAVHFDGKKEFTLPPLYKGKVSHDVENMMASYALCRAVGITPQQFLKSFATFQKPPHRIEFVRKVRGVAYHDDSKGSNVDAVVKAVASMKGSVFLIAEEYIRELATIPG